MPFLHRALNVDSREKLHPYVNAKDLYYLLDGGDDIRDITICTSRGWATPFIPEEWIGPNDRNYASILVIGWDRTAEIMGNYDPKNPPMLHGLPISLSLAPADLPEVTEILESAAGLVRENKTRYVNIVACSLDSSLTVDPRRIVKQKTEIVVEDQARPLAGPSRRGSKRKPRYNPVRRSDRA